MISVREGARGTCSAILRCRLMRNEDYDRELLVCVALICSGIAAIAGIPASVPDPSLATVSVLERPEPVRIVGTPFVPNTNPAIR